MKRLFVAIKVIPNPDFVQCLSGLQRQLHASKIRWVQPSLMHTTIKFLGPTPNEKIALVKNTLASVSKNLTPIKLELDQLGIFGSSYNPKVIWLGATDSSQAKIFGNTIIDAFHEVGFLKDRQNYVPHLTLGRIRNIDNKKYFQEVMDRYRHCFQQELVFNKMILIESRLTSSGPIYHEMSDFNIRL